MARLDDTLDEYPAVPPARRKLAQDTFEQGTRLQQRAEHWKRLETHASRFMAAFLSQPKCAEARRDVARDAIDAARELVAEIDRQRADEEPGG